MSQKNWKRFIGPVSALFGFVALIIAFSVVMTVAFSSDDSDGSNGSGIAADRVDPNYDLSTFNVNVTLTDEGIEPDILFLPAGRQIRLLIKNHGLVEHHYRIIGLDPTNLRWLRTPEVSEDEIDSLTDEELAAFGIVDISTVTDEAEIEHLLHHLTPWFERNRDASPSGIKPIGTEVHGWVIRGTLDLIEFFALEPGEYLAEDVRFPDHTARVIVYPPPEDAAAGA